MRREAVSQHHPRWNSFSVMMNCSDYVILWSASAMRAAPGACLPKLSSVHLWLQAPEAGGRGQCGRRSVRTAEFEQCPRAARTTTRRCRWAMRRPRVLSVPRVIHLGSHRCSHVLALCRRLLLQHQWSLHLLPCPPGTFASVVNSTVCQPCSVNSYTNASSQTRCESCTLNTYIVYASAADERMSGRCMTCPGLALCTDAVPSAQVRVPISSSISLPAVYHPRSARRCPASTRLSVSRRRSPTVSSAPG